MKSVCATLATALVATGCSNFGHLELDPVEPPPAGVTVAPPQITIPVGITVVVHAEAVDTGGSDMLCDVALEARDPSILIAERTTSGPIALTGASPGKTPITVYCDGDVVDTLSGEVTAAPSM